MQVLDVFIFRFFSSLEGGLFLALSLKRQEPFHHGDNPNGNTFATQLLLFTIHTSLFSNVLFWDISERGKVGKEED